MTRFWNIFDLIRQEETTKSLDMNSMLFFWKGKNIGPMVADSRMVVIRGSKVWEHRIKNRLSKYILVAGIT